MKNVTFTIPHNENKISALKMFLDKKSLKLEDELKTNNKFFPPYSIDNTT